MGHGKKWLVGVCGAAVVAGAVTLAAQSTVVRLGIDLKDWQQEAVESLVNGSAPEYPNRKQFRAASPAVRVAFVKEGMAWAKAYSESPAFLAAYNKERAQAKPAPPQSKGTPDAQYAKYLADQRKSLEETKQNLAKMSPEMQKQLAGTVKELEAEIDKEAKDPQQAALYKQGFAQQAVADQQDYQKRQAAYAAQYPANPKVLIAKRLREFLDITKDVAFDAKLESAGGGYMRFSNPNYERKSDEWKLCYRAGKDACEAARAFATDWLRQLPTK